MVAAFGGWLLLVGKADAHEIAVGAGAAIVAGTFAQIATQGQLRRPWERVVVLAQAWRLPRYAVTGTWEVLVVLVKHLAGKEASSLFFTVPFADCGDDEMAATKRALAVTYTTMTPNFVVVAIDRKRQRMIYHQIARSEVPVMTRNLGAGES